MRNRLESYFLKVIKEERKGFFAFCLKGFLRFVSWGFSFCVFCRNWAYDKELMHRYHPSTPLVISIGNIVAGGTGKTPVTNLLAKQFCNHFILAILSRGYRSPAERFSEPLMLSKGNGPIYPATLCGDEPYLLSENLPKAFVFVGRNRQKSSLMAAKVGAQVILIDDGMQHRQIARDLEVVVINANDPFGRGYFLPRGFLREGLSALSRADLIIINHVKSQDHFVGLKKILEKYTKADCVGTEFATIDILNFHNAKIDSLKNKKIGLFCGIGQPEQFKQWAVEQEAIIVDQYFTPDHTTPSHKALHHFADQCAQKGADFLLCTEKDRVKVAEWAGVIPLVWVKAELKLVSGHDQWHSFIERAKNKISLLA